MGTRLRYEYWIRNALPQIRYLRVYSPGEFQVFIYAADENLNLDEQLAQQLKSVIDSIGLAHLEHIIKPYQEIKSDGVANSEDPPVEIKLVAMIGELNEEGVKNSVNTAFPFLKLQMVTSRPGVLTFHIPEDVTLSEIENELVQQYLQEFVPLGAKVELVHS